MNFKYLHLKTDWIMSFYKKVKQITANQKGK